MKVSHSFQSSNLILRSSRYGKAWYLKKAKTYIVVQNYKISAPRRARSVRSGKHTQVGQQRPAGTKHTQFRAGITWIYSLISCSFSLSDFCCFRFDAKQAKSCIFSLPRETKFSLQFQFSLRKRKRGRTLLSGNDTVSKENAVAINLVFKKKTCVILP